VNDSSRKDEVAEIRAALKAYQAKLQHEIDENNVDLVRRRRRLRVVTFVGVARERAVAVVLIFLTAGSFMALYRITDVYWWMYGAACWYTVGGILIGWSLAQRS
jgi:hypothetical protein